MAKKRLSLAADLMLVHTDPGGLTTWVNAAFTARTGYTLAEMVGRRPGAVLQGAASSAEAIARMSQAIRSGQACRLVDLVNYRKDGAPISITLDIEPQHDARGRLVGFVSSQLDTRDLPPQTQRQQILERWHDARVGDQQLGFFERHIETDEAHWDERMYELYDRSPSNGPLDRDSLLKIMLPEDAGRIAAEWLVDYPLGYSHTSYRIRLRNGAVRWLQSDWTLLPGPDGSRVASGTVRDITEQIERQQVAEREHSQLLLAAELGKIGLMTEIAATRERQFNAAYLRMYGFDPGQAPRDEEVLARVHPDDRAQVSADWAALRSGVKRHSEGRKRILHPDGRTVYVLIRRGVVGGLPGKPMEFIAAVVDITDLTLARQREQHLSESRALALELTGLSLWQLSADAETFDIDGRMLQAYGSSGSAARVPAAQWLQAVHPADRARMQALWERARRGESMRGSEDFRVVRPSGEVRWLNANFASIQSPDGEFGGLRGTMLDVTDRRQLRVDLQLERELLADTQRLACMGAWRREIGSDRVHWSDEMYRLLRRDPVRGPYRSDERQRCLTAHSWAVLRTAAERARAAGSSYELELEVCREDGTQAQMRYWAEFERDTDGTPLAERGCLQDISHLVALRNASEVDRARLQALFDGALNGIFLLDDAARFMDVNPAGCRLLGYARDELMGLDPSQLWVQDPAQSRSVDWVTLYRRFIRQRRATRRLRLRCKDGGLKVVEFSGVAHIQTGVHLGIVLDVTARVQTEQALELSQSRLRELTQRQEEDNEAFRAELAREVHDQLGQTLGALKLEIDFIADEVPDAALRMRRLIQDGLIAVREVSRSLRPAALDMGLATALAALAHETSMRSEVDVKFHLLESPLRDSDQTVHALFRIAQEAVANAVRHAQAREVALTLSRSGSGLQLEIRDDGRGFDTSALPLQPGLGLLGMAERARQIGAALTVRSEPGAGTTIQVRWGNIPATWAIPAVLEAIAS